MAKINEMQMLSLFVGGRDGGIIAASGAVSGQVIHMIEVLEDDTTFTVLSGENQDGTARNLISANGYNGVALGAGALVFAPFGGYISAFTADKSVRYFRMPASDRTQNNS